MTIATTALGTVRGIVDDGCEIYRGIPYAAPPVGELRFRPPEPVKPWGGELDATDFGASCWQPPPLSGGILPRRDPTMDEECLFLNVFTPAADDAGRPVLVWIHGGAYQAGAADHYDGRSFARRGDIVVVTINYRLGPFGFLDLGDLDASYAGSHNNGIRDQIEALRWVRDHIADFGGDPAQITICGESAGAGSVAALLSAPAATGLFHRAISQSAPAGFGPPTPGMVDAFTEAVGHTDLFGVGPEELIAAHVAIAASAQGDRGVALLGNGGRSYRPVVDGITIDRPAAEAVAGRGSEGVPLLIGTNAHEGTLFQFFLPEEVSDEELHTAVAEHSADPDGVVAAFRREYPDHDNRTLAVEMLTDTMFRTPSLRVADAQVGAGTPVHVYRFSWESRGFGGAFGATHALEIPFVWNGDISVWEALIGDGAPYPPTLALQMHDAWIAFVRTGDPNHDGIPEWPEYDTSERPTMDFGDTAALLRDPGGATRAAWG